MATAVTERFAATGETNYAALTPTQWSEILHHETEKKLYFRIHGMMGKDTSEDMSLTDDVALPPIIEKDDLTKEPGDRIRMPLIKKLSGAGVSGTTSLEGSEEDFELYYLDVYIELLRHASGYKGFMNKQRSAVPNIDGMVRKLLTNWLAQKEDDAIFGAFYNGYAAHIITELTAASSTTHPNILYAGTATSTAELTSANKFDAEMLERLSVWAEVNYINPIMVDGEPHWVVIVHPYQMKTLREDPTWAQAQREAGVRGSKNAIFTKAAGVYSNMVVHTSTKIDAEGASGDDVNIRKAILMGAHAIAHARGSRPFTEKLDNTDYALAKGWSINSIFGDRRADWVSDDGAATNLNQSSALVKTWASNPNG